MTPNKLKLIAVITLVTMVAAACTSPGGSTQLKTGAVQTQTISVPLPPDTSKPVDVTLRLGAAELTAGAGAAKLAEGTVQYNVPEFQPSVSQSGNKVDITQGPTGGFQGILPKDLVNKWNIKFSNSVPLNLVVQAGAYSGSWDLGGLRLQSLKWDEGASQVHHHVRSGQPGQDGNVRFHDWRFDRQVDGTGEPQLWKDDVPERLG